ncbi:DNA-3-methyladenine glycosylase II [Aspergillus candidus]|uniref:Putative DNA-3-methyladenine glycosylase n=1 Tax=Aspergillus candidus TaxID=41067 RepID=A0A2I2FEE6_ASPCN|nr:putative DNA-3-methyladenine glycosylase [Aspergillus candidus]PLB38969.1 putative DNA-3-methyladenine glycosylase [Aspergillus candidus]
MMSAVRRSARLSVASDTKASLIPSVQPNKRGKTQRSSSGISKPTRKAPAKGRGSQVKASIPEIDQISSAQSSGDTPTVQSNSNKHGHSANYWDPSPTTTSRIDSTPPPLDRPVEPHRTNATLLTPHGSSLVAYPAASEAPSPSKTSRPRRPSPLATTGTLLEKAVAHLIATDPRLEPVIRQYPCPLFSPEGLAEQVDPFRSLVSSIIGQQVSGAAAKSIKEKFVALFQTGAAGNTSSGDSNNSSDNSIPRKDYFPTPEEISRCDIAVLRTAGLSQRKAEYILGLAEKFASGELSARMLLDAEDEELLETLTAVRGLGRWSVEMFACFALKRTDVFSTGDLGVQRGCAAFVGKDVSKLKAKGGGKFKYMPEKEMLEVAANFAPYRSLFMWYMWRIENVDVAVLR